MNLIIFMYVVSSPDSIWRLCSVFCSIQFCPVLFFVRSKEMVHSNVTEKYICLSFVFGANPIEHLLPNRHVFSYFNQFIDKKAIEI